MGDLIASVSQRCAHAPRGQEALYPLAGEIAAGERVFLDPALA